MKRENLLEAKLMALDGRVTSTRLRSWLNLEYEAVRLTFNYKVRRRYKAHVPVGD